MKTIRWETDRVLTEARKRTAALMTDNTKRVQTMLEELMQEAGWSEFIDALCTDVIHRTGRHPKHQPLLNVADIPRAIRGGKRTG